MKRATTVYRRVFCVHSNFNPRPREEGDLRIIDVLTEHLDISIHALVKRATYAIRGDRPSILISIHALVKRATSSSSDDFTTSIYFNPRPREEGDLCHGRGKIYYRFISIHALVKRATACVKRWENFTGISIHALVKRATWHTSARLPVTSRFQSTPS